MKGADMGREKQRVLEMVADGTITAAEGAKLLEALGSAGGADTGKPGGKRRYTASSSVLSAIGPMIQATIGDVFKGRKSFEAYENVPMEEVQSVAEAAEPGGELVIHGSVHKGASLSVALVRSEDDTLRASVDNGTPVRMGNKDNRRIMLWNSGELTVHVPDCLGSVKVYSRGGGISSNGIRIPVDLKTMGGGIRITRPGDSFSIKTMGGGLEITLDSSWKGNSKAKTMGGGISVHLHGTVPVLVRASTLGGSITATGPSASVLSDTGNGHGKSKIAVQYGSGGPELSVVSMGGGIVIEEKEDE
jgi:hypothetical protein